jgi:hypothetical protein
MIFYIFEGGGGPSLSFFLSVDLMAICEIAIHFALFFNN